MKRNWKLLRSSNLEKSIGDEAQTDAQKVTLFLTENPQSC